MNETATGSMQKSIQVLLGLFVLSAMTASGCTKVVEWVSGKSEFVQLKPTGSETTAAEMVKYANCVVKSEDQLQLTACKKMRETFSAETRAKFDEMKKLKLQDCIDFDRAYLTTFEAILSKRPTEADFFVAKACEERIEASDSGIKEPSDPKSAWALVRATKIDLGDRVLLNENLKSLKESRVAKAEKSFLPISMDIRNNKLSCETAQTQITEHIKLGSIKALLYSAYCENAKCENSKDSVACAKSLALAKKAADTGNSDGWVYLATFEINQGKTEVGLEHARKALALGNVQALEMIPALRDEVFKVKVTRTMAISALAVGSRYGFANDPLKVCSETVLFEEWKHSGKKLNPDQVSESDWQQFVSDWADPVSKDYNPKLVTRFACEILSDPETKKKIYDGAIGEHKIDFCLEIKDPRFASLCAKSTAAKSVAKSI
jgi:hypothetical protein